MSRCCQWDLEAPPVNINCFELGIKYLRIKAEEPRLVALDARQDASTNNRIWQIEWSALSHCDAPS